MKKRFMSILLILCMVLTLLPTAAMAVGSSTLTAKSSKTPGDENYYDSDVTWLGTTSEYQKTLSVFFDSGLRKVAVGNKYGLVDIYGAFVVQPIYDKIEAYYWHKEYNGVKETNQNKQRENIFVDGYVQATRNGKMGLIDSKGKEVIPCNYDAVGLPSEGISRIAKKVNGKTYLGYWNLEQGKEIVAPNKYVLSDGYEYLGEPAGGSLYGFFMPDIGEDRYASALDFYNGYALVFTGKVINVTEQCDFKFNSKDRKLIYAQIIDKNGKEVLSGGPYPFNINPSITRPYPQAGPYMVYDELSTKRLRMISDAGDEIIYTSHLESGIVGPKGIIVSPQYHGGIWGNSAIGWYPPGAQIKIIPELSLAITYKCGYEGFKESAAHLGVINFSNKVIIPFGGLDFLSYDSESRVFDGAMYQPIYRPDGTKIPGTAERASYIVNGYVIMGEMDGHGKIISAKGVTLVKAGKSYTHENLKGSTCTSVSTKDTLWVKKGSQWGLVNVNGNIILPFEYEEIDDSAWLNTTSPYATVKKNGKWGMVDTLGKVLLPCNYSSIKWGEDGYINIQDYTTGKYGIYNLNSFKITTACSFTGSINNTRFVQNSWGAIAGTVPIQVGNSLKALFDMDTGKQLTSTYLVMKPSSRGLFWSTYGDIFGPDGRIVFSRAEDSSSYTLVVKDGKVGSINASRLKIGGKLPTTTFVKPVPAPITPKGYLVEYPEKQLYMVGDGFDTTGLIMHYEDENGVRSVIDNSKLKFYTSGTVELTQGRAFTTHGVKKVETQYNGKKVSAFEVKVVGVADSDIMQTGDYYMQIYSKYLYPVWSGGTYYIELSDKKPDKPFKVKLLDYSDDRGAEYSISYDGTYIVQPSSKNGDQLRSSNIPHMWRINKYSSFCTIRDYGNQKLIVNASGQKSANGTKVTVWSSTGSAPDNAKVVFTPAN